MSPPPSDPQAGPPPAKPRPRFTDPASAAADPARPRANKVFTDRDEPQAHFHRARANLPADQHRLLVFYGVGGQGKTRLRRHLCEGLERLPKPERPRVGVLDFHVAPYRDPARGLLALRRSLRESGRLAMPVFDVAIARYWQLAYPGEDLTRTLGDLFGDPDGVLGGIADGAREWLGLAEELPAGLRLGIKAIARIRDGLTARGAHQACAALGQLPGLEPDQLAERLPWFLGLDLQAHRAAHPDQPALVVFIDTFEALWSDAPVKTGLGAAETDAWVRDLVAGAPGVLFVILGRERLTWDRRFPDDWARLLGDQHLLGGLAEADARAFLRQVPFDPDASAAAGRRRWRRRTSECWGSRRGRAG